MQLRHSHLKIADKLQRHDGNIRFTSDKQWFAFPRSKTQYNVIMLTELKQQGIISKDNKITAKGQLWLLYNQIVGG